LGKYFTVQAESNKIYVSYVDRYWLSQGRGCITEWLPTEKTRLMKLSWIILAHPCPLVKTKRADILAN